jgi:hypothetical protein
MRGKSLLATAALAVSLSACGHGATKADATKLKSNAQVQQDAAQAQKIIDDCLTRGSFVTSTGRRAIVTCIAPPGHAPQFEACAQQQLSSAHLTTKTGREAYLQSVVLCGESNR